MQTAEHTIKPNNRSAERINDRIHDVEKFLEPPYHIDENDFIVTEEDKQAIAEKLTQDRVSEITAYNPETAEDKKELEHRKMNKLRTSWFCNILLAMSLLAQELEPEHRREYKEKISALTQHSRQTVKQTGKNSLENINRVEQLAADLVQAVKQAQKIKKAAA